MVRELINEELLPSRTYQVLNGHILNAIDGPEAMQQAIEKALLTPRFSLPWLTKNYGSDLEQLVGQSSDYAKAEVERMIVETFLTDKRVTNVSVSNIEISEKNSLLVHAEIATSYGLIIVRKEVTT